MFNLSVTKLPKRVRSIELTGIVVPLSMTLLALPVSASPNELLLVGDKLLPKSVCAHLDSFVMQMIEKETKGNVKAFEIDTDDQGNYMIDRDIHCFGVVHSSKGQFGIEYGLYYTPKGLRIIFWNEDINRNRPRTNLDGLADIIQKRSNNIQ